MKKKALITGISGQDAAYLTKLLLEKNYEVIGTTRSYTNDSYKKLAILGISDQDIKLENCDLKDYSDLFRIYKKHQPCKIFNLAAQSSVFNSFQHPIGTIDFNINSVLNHLEIIRNFYPDVYFYQATSSEMFGDVKVLPINEDNAFNPQSPYAISKATSYWLVKLYRESYKLKVCSGILFNHESILRENTFFIKKLVENAVKAKNKQINEIVLGNLNIKRDFGYAPKYVEAMYKMLDRAQVDDFIICSGRSIELNDIVSYVLKRLDLPKSILKIDSNLFRPSEIYDIYGDNSKARKELGWDYDLDFYDVLDEIIQYELTKF